MLMKKKSTKKKMAVMIHGRFGSLAAASVRRAEVNKKHPSRSTELVSKGGYHTVISRS
jgi:hypothetical protein